jgi:Carboxypeptidase regulatory-like domain
MKKSFLTLFSSIKTLMFTALIVLFGSTMSAQVTSSSIGGVIKDKKTNETLIGASVIAVHVPSGTRYGSITNEDGRFFLPAVRVGGPYKVTVSFVGYKAQNQDNVYAALGTTANVNFSVSSDEEIMPAVEVIGLKNDVFSSNRTGAASTINSAQLATLPTIGSRSINDFTKYNAQGNGRNFAGQDARLNNITIDGSVFNNGFGLGNSAIAGGRTGSTAISLDAVEEIQVNVAPFDIRQSGFVGAGVNAVTRSGTNDLSASVYYNTRNENMVGNKARNLPVTVNKFSENIVGFRIGAPIIKNKLFFFGNYERQRRIDPATGFVASGSSNTGTATRVTKADLDALSSFMKDKYGYETGPYENFDLNTNSDKFLIRLDYNLSDFHKLNLRYSNHESQTDVPISNSNSLGFGNRRDNANSMSFQNSGYIIQDNTRSLVAELNSTFGSKLSNSFIASYNVQNEDRVYKYAYPKNANGRFPTIDIQNAGLTYIGLGMDPFTPENKLDYTTFQLTDNVRYYAGKNTFTLGASFERFNSNNLFFPGSNAVYTFASLSDFYDAANQNLTGNPKALPTNAPRFQYRYTALPNGELPLQKLGVTSISMYGQDEVQVTPRLNITAGLRVTGISMDQTGLENPTVTGYTFKDPRANNANFSVNTSTLPKRQTLIEPRVGFNFDVMGDKTLQIRGGAGIFTGRPPYVWISNQIGNNGILTGFIDQSRRFAISGKGDTINPFTTDPSVFNPSDPTKALPAFDLAVTDADYKFPQVLKNSLALDYKLPFGFVASVEAMYTKNLNAVVYYNYNLENAIGTIEGGPDNRPRFPGFGLLAQNVAARRDTLNRVQDNVSALVAMNSTNQGSNSLVTFKLEKTLTKGFGGMIAYTYQNTKDLMAAGSIASGSFNAVPQVNGANTLPLTLSDFDLPHRVIGYLSYKLGYGGKGRFGGDITFSLGFEAIQSGRFSYLAGGDLNGDGLSNDLLFVPNKATDFVFTPNRVTTTNITYTPEQQAAAFEAYIAQDPYLSSKRGQYTERNAGILPWLTTADLSIIKDFNVLAGGKKNTLQLRFDIINVGNFLNKSWGVGQRLTGGTPITITGLAADNKTPTYRFNTQSMTNPDNTASTFLIRDTYVNRNSINDVWTAQIGIRYSFN